MSDISPLFTSSPMPNEYFNIQPTYQNDKLLADSWTTEAFNKFGIPTAFYVTDYDVNYDRINEEDLDRHIIRKFDVMLYTNQLSDELQLFGNAGIVGLDNIHFYAAMSHFSTASTYGLSGTDMVEGVYPEFTPKRGCIIKTEYNDRWYEIVNIQQQTEQFLQTRHSWDFTCLIHRDNHFTVSSILSGDTEISGVTDVFPDVYNVSGTATYEATENILYIPPVTEKRSDIDVFNGW